MSMVDAGLGKFQSFDGWRFWFGEFGYPPWMSTIVGVFEIGLPVFLIFPRFASYAAMLLAVIMLGALHAVLTHETDLGWFDPALHLTFLAIIGSVRWKRRWRPNSRSSGASVVATILFLSLGLLGRFASPLSAQTLPDTPTQEAALLATADSILNHYAAIDQMSGVALIGIGDRVVYDGAFGMANHDWNIPNSIDTRFRIGSITKQFTAAVVLQLRDEGRLSLDDPLSHHLPEVSGTVAADLTIRELLVHRTGLPEFTAFDDYQTVVQRLRVRPDSIFKAVVSRPLDFEPDSQWAYSNSNYLALGLIIERITGLTYRDAMQERVFDPLLLRDTNVDVAGIRPRLASGYIPVEGVLRLEAYRDPSSALAAGDIVSTATDLFRWTRHIANRTALLAPNSIGEMVTPQSIMNAERGTSYGYGFMLQESDSDISWVEHGGVISGFVSWQRWIPESDVTLILLGNSRGSQLPRIIRELTALLRS